MERVTDSSGSARGFVCELGLVEMLGRPAACFRSAACARGGSRLTFVRDPDGNNVEAVVHQ